MIRGVLRFFFMKERPTSHDKFVGYSYSESKSAILFLLLTLDLLSDALFGILATFPFLRMHDGDDWPCTRDVLGAVCSGP
jgi:hypothetical protein